LTNCYIKTPRTYYIKSKYNINYEIAQNKQYNSKILQLYVQEFYFEKGCHQETQQCLAPSSCEALARHSVYLYANRTDESNSNYCISMTVEFGSNSY